MDEMELAALEILRAVASPDPQAEKLIITTGSNADDDSR